MPQAYRRQVREHRGLVAGMFDALGLTDVIDRATPQHPEMRLVTAGQAVKAMGLNGLGVVNQPRYLVPRFFHQKPTPRLMAPGIDAKPLTDDTFGRALDTLDAYDGTALSSRMATTAAHRLGLTPTLAHLDSPSFHVDGRSNSPEEPDARVMHLTRGYRRAHRPDRKHVLLD